MKAEWFPRVVAHHPYIIFIAVFVLSSICMIIPFMTNKLPDFRDPQMGFEARGTVLAKRLTAWHNLVEATKGRAELIDNPLEYQLYVHQQANQQSDRKKKSRNKNRNKNKKGKNRKKSKTDSNFNQTLTEDPFNEISANCTPTIDINANKNQEHVDGEHFFCNLPTSSYSRVIIGARSKDKDLWSLEGVLAQCRIDDVLRGNVHFPSLCQVAYEGSAHQKCCRSWSPANYVALLSNRTSCLGVTENDLSKVKTLLQQCSHYYYNRQLLPNCADDLKCQREVPAECYARNAVYHLLHYLLDVDFISNAVKKDNENDSTLKSAMLFLPIAASSATLDFYNAIDNDDLTYGDFHVQGMQLGLKTTLFDEQLVSDSRLLLGSFIFITLCIWAYTGSIILTITTIFTVLFSLGISYAVYTLVLRITFFPFMNLLAIVVAIGIGADDAFVYCKIYESGKQQKRSNDGLRCLIQETMKHAFPSMFVTSFTTAVAFFASSVSNVTAINCFSLFAGMTVIANFVLMVTWIPACMVISEHCKITLSPMNFITRKIIRPLRLFGDQVTEAFTAFLIEMTLRLQWIWLPSLGILAIICCVIVFHYPGLQLPDYINFQLFHKSHLFEQYEMTHVRRFWFEREEMIGRDAEILPMRFVWGMNPVDNGNYLDPTDKGTADWDETFNISDPKSQVWLARFCQDLRKQPFYRTTTGPLLPNCFIESLRSWMERRCEDPIDPSINYAPCCQSSRFPFKPDVLQRCAAAANAELHRSPYLWIRNGGISAGLKFVKPTALSSPPMLNDTLANATELIPEIKALIVEYDSTYAYTFSFTNMDEFFHQVESWMQKQLRDAPKGMRGGWFVSNLEFYELQRALHEGTLWAIGVSLMLALIVLAFVTLNPLISLFAIMTVGAAIIVTVAILILLGWKLDVLESVAVSTAIGLAVDFSLHYAVSYKGCISNKRTDRVKVALQRMGGPTLMAAVTSGAAGALMLPSHVLAYIQIGVFLLLVMGVSWLYATLFLCPMLAIMGPLQFAQFKYSKLKRLICFHKYNDDDNVIEADKDNNQAKKICKGRGMQSESTLSTSSSACQFHCSELETLAVRPPSPSLPPSPLSTLLPQNLYVN
ncbi:hypothetical protein DMN91_003866 [Ooceraea biroi]|uniref:Dispatched-like protein n=1 Tax=Ooceraea biroi TaxID=2015173 RepID=A0A026W815_OOCBI|nr:protein dispatched [Ooceraea biroi]XP_026825197.1 protein dispatched [Ooceraea biroi]XP_026825198.1 protein dispatched [Ooceraea biroi]EZA51791.1 Dispatched-like protein [Ooceraea biroi]RLU23660.1 hypothetical protein DMN91_003866 [Ooceraea biroi]